MKRATLAKIVANSANEAGLDFEKNVELVSAVLDPEVKCVGWGQFTNPPCPTTLAARKCNDSYWDRYDDFWKYFDDAMCTRWFFFGFLRGIHSERIKVRGK